jgi:hypothetical protein
MENIEGYLINIFLRFFLFVIVFVLSNLINDLNINSYFIFTIKFYHKKNKYKIDIFFK